MARDPSPFQPVERFSGRETAYARYRPHYPQAVITALAAEFGLTPQDVVADIGSGTGISSMLFLGNGNPVFGVEPNAEMRGAAAEALAEFPRYTSVAGRAEATALATASVDLVTAGQAWHWFEPVATRREFARILRPPRRVSLFWNTRLAESSPLMHEYDALVRRFSSDYARVRHDRVGPEDIASLFQNRRFTYRTFPNSHDLDFETLVGRTFSSSYMPPAHDPRAPAVIAELRALFERFEHAGLVHFHYMTELYFGYVEAG